MPGITSSFSNLFSFLGLMAPLLLTFFVVASSLFNTDLKGIVYLGGLLCASVINLFFMNSIKSTRSIDADVMCELWNIDLLKGWNDYNSPALGSMYMGFTFIYLFLPMLAHKQVNYAMIATILFLFGLNASVNLGNKCNKMDGIFLGVLSGILLGMCWYGMFHAAGYDSLLYYPEMQSNNVICKKPSKQTFKCNVYKNGEIVSTMAA
jgi:hypothetical protein